MGFLKIHSFSPVISIRGVSTFLSLILTPFLVKDRFTQLNVSYHCDSELLTDKHVYPINDREECNRIPGTAVLFHLQGRVKKEISNLINMVT